MTRPAVLVLGPLMLASLALSGCAVAAVPVVAAVGITRSQDYGSSRSAIRQEMARQARTAGASPAGVTARRSTQAAPAAAPVDAKAGGSRLSRAERRQARRALKQQAAIARNGANAGDTAQPARASWAERRRSRRAARAGGAVPAAPQGVVMTGLSELPPPDGAPANRSAGGGAVLTDLRELPPPGSTMATAAASPRQRLRRGRRDTVVAPSAAPVPAAAPAISAGAQYLYGSGEAAALSIQAYKTLRRYALDRALDRKMGAKAWSVTLARGATLTAPSFTDCGDKPLAVVVDIDETAILNLGFQAAEAGKPGGIDADRWQRWERSGAADVVAVPGAVDALKDIRDVGVTVIFSSDRTAENAAGTAAALAAAGLGPAVLGTTLILRGDAGMASSGKDERRWRIADKYCVIALVGDQLDDFSDLFDATGPLSQRRAAPAGQGVAALWGAGWFMLPNPVYGRAVAGGVDDIFPADKRWADPGPDVAVPAVRSAATSPFPASR